ncbi:hypothetical protein K449DRAFT_190401 [Hypoxylon sp. EC38]|nr:hypothetical protein K449DRAFT_190401 [Hypoxylon sp. EC38]
MWLRDYLPDNFQYCRILLYGYDSKVPGSRSDQSIREIAGTCKNVILDFRKLTKTENRPVIWIGQSMGGLIVQEVLSQSRQHRSFNLPGNLLTCSLGFLGYGVPTNGLKNDSLLEVVRGQPNFEMIKSICIEDNRASHYLNDLAKRFPLCEDSLSIYYFYETNPSDDLLDARAPARRRVDDPEAVDRENTYWIPRNHSELVKISSRSDYTYMITTQVISIILNSTRSN